MKVQINIYFCAISQLPNAKCVGHDECHSNFAVLVATNALSLSVMRDSGRDGPACIAANVTALMGVLQAVLLRFASSILPRR